MILDATNRAIEEALDGRCDMVVTIGGISAGKRDFFPEVFGKMGVELVVKGANIQPGKPVIVGKHKNAIVLGLPGNPVSALACCCVFGWPIVLTVCLVVRQQYLGKPLHLHPQSNPINVAPPFDPVNWQTAK